MLGSFSHLRKFNDISATVMGLGRFGGGVAAAKFLAQQGARVTITDLRTPAELQDSLKQLKDTPIDRLFLGSHPDEAFDDIDLLVVNPAVKPSHPQVACCRAAGVTITSEIELFLSRQPGRVIAVTGTNGKSTTSALIAHLLEPWAAENKCHVWLGGNIGNSLLPQLDDISENNIVVLELSSFQLEHLRDSKFAPEIAVMTNFAPNHLDWHETTEAYRSAKQVIFQSQRSSDAAIIFEDDEDPAQWRIRGRCFRFGTHDFSEAGAFLTDGSLILRRHNFEDVIRLELPSALPGQHNADNVAAAACASWIAGADPDSFQTQLDSFQSLPHRLQLVSAGKGVRFYNDSNSTTPESAVAALQTFSQPVVLIAGGSDKGADLSEMARAISAKTVAAVLMGETAETLMRQIAEFREDQQNCPVIRSNDLRSAFLQAVALVPEGGIVLLSPGCASYGLFRDYRDRGEQFAKLAQEWTKV